ncbi:hypothetical protein [Lacticaseibacillus hulanensis]|uniref:hypothetical protein n=1 Tax=Lacticaseibacillus hulanensis TaxID=2493111 RepID=UPI000FDC79D6|nr:hypothetical protein [Lacticaseibacillus hulanensis]
MKKIVGITVAALAMLALAGCSSSSTSSKDAATISSLKKENKKLTSDNKKYKKMFDELSGGDSSADSSSSTDKSDSAETYKIGQEADFGNGSKKQLGLTITAADQHWNAFAREQGDSIFEGKQPNTVQVQIKYTNFALGESYLPSTSELNVYDENGTAATPLDYQEGQTEVTDGHTGTTTVWYVFDKPFSQIKKFTIEYVPDDTPLATWTISK